MIKTVKNFYEKHNLRPFESNWLLGVHILAIFGLIYAITEYGLFAKILLTHCIFHNIWALGITTGAHRLWAHKSYKATTLWKTIIMILNSGTICYKFRCKPRINLPLEQRSQTSSQVLRY